MLLAINKILLTLLAIITFRVKRNKRDKIEIETIYQCEGDLYAFMFQVIHVPNETYFVN